MRLIDKIKVSRNRREKSKESDARNLNQAGKLLTHSESPTLDSLHFLYCTQSHIMLWPTAHSS